MANQDLFKQAIAEAKSVREAAIANAKEALEETITPHLKDLLAAKLQEMEAQDEAAEIVNEEEEIEEAMHDEDMDEGKKDDEETMEEAKHEDELDEAKDDEVDEAQGNIDAHEENPHDQLEEEEATEEEEAVAEAEDEEKAEDESEESDDEANGEEEAEEEVEVKDMEVEDLKALIRDLIAQEMGHGGEEELGMDMDAEEQPADMVGAEDEEIDLDELLKELEGLAEGEKEDEMEEATEASVEESINPLQAELDQALATIQELNSNLSEVNLLNAKLLYLNKIFRNNNLTEAQKVNVIAAFDKATSAKEVKLVFETLNESIVTKKQDTTIKESKGFASKATGNSTKGEVINEVSEQVRRMQKLAGIIR